MKHLSFLLVIALLCSVMVSCNKEGQFSPKKQISKITCSNSSKSEYYGEYGWETLDESSSNYVSQIWNWNGKQLESIDHYSDGTLQSTEYFVYEGKKLTSINWGGAERYEFIYEKGKLSTIELYDGSTREAIYNIEHNGKKLSKITVTYFDSKAANAHPLPSWILNLPQRPQRHNNMNDPKGTDTYEMLYEWDGDNVKHITYLEDGDREDIYYTYDNKLNPMCGLWEMEGSDVSTILSKNNVTREEYRYDGESEVYNYSYTYNGNVPSTQTHSYYYSSDDYRYTSNTTNIYDYK
jgi:hypothetical protein